MTSDNVSQIGDYLIDGVLGTGAAGTAYRGHHIETGEPVAIKWLSEQMSKSEVMQRRFLREMMVLEQTNHPNIVRYVDGGIHEGRFFYAMEIVTHGTLKEVLQKRRRLTPAEVVSCGIQICGALQRAKEAGIVHRDLKPANLFLSEEGLIKLGDFGLARETHGQRLTAEGTTVGTCLYMAPEQIQGLAVTHATDLYALGCLLFQMLVGRVPYLGDTTFAVLDQHLSAAPPDASSFVAETPPGLSDLICRLLAKEPRERPADAGQVREMLQEIQLNTSGGEGGQASSTPLLADLAQQVETGDMHGTPSASWRTMVLIAVAIVVVIAGAAWFNR